MRTVIYKKTDATHGPGRFVEELPGYTLGAVLRNKYKASDEQAAAARRYINEYGQAHIRISPTAALNIRQEPGTPYIEGVN